MSIAIIGGGIGGLLLANCFEQCNIPYILYEKLDSKYLTRISKQSQLFKNVSVIIIHKFTI